MYAAHILEFFEFGWPSLKFVKGKVLSEDEIFYKLDRNFLKINIRYFNKQSGERIANYFHVIQTF